jgi:hypothetical protein
MCMERDYGDDELFQNQEGWCKHCSVDYEKIKDKIKELNGVIILLGEPVLGEYDLEKSTWKETKRAMEELHEDREYWQSIRTFVSSNEGKPKEKSLLDLFAYLLLVEGFYSKIVKILSLMLVENHHDLYDPLRGEFVSSSEQMEKIDLSVKLKFLRKHGFGLFVDSVDRKLRNDIAHLNFRVTDDGKIVDKRSGNELTDLEKKMQLLLWSCVLVIMPIEYLFWKCKDPQY